MKRRVPHKAAHDGMTARSGKTRYGYETCLAVSASFIEEVERQPCHRPVHRNETARCGKRDIGRLQILAAKADIRRDEIICRRVDNLRTVRGEGCDTRIEDRGDTDIAFGINGK